MYLSSTKSVLKYINRMPDCHSWYYLEMEIQKLIVMSKRSSKSDFGAYRNFRDVFLYP